MAESDAMHWICGDPSTGRGQSLVAREMCLKPLMACVQIFRCVGFASGKKDRKCNRRNVKVSQADLFTVFGRNQQCHGIFAGGFNVSGSWNLPLKRWNAGWLRIHEKVTKHAKKRHKDLWNRRKECSHDAQMTTDFHKGALSMCFEQQIALVHVL